MSENANKKSSAASETPKINLDLDTTSADFELEGSAHQSPVKSEGTSKLAIVHKGKEDDMDFNLEFEDESANSQGTLVGNSTAKMDIPSDESLFDIDIDMLKADEDFSHHNSTQKTIIFDKKSLGPKEVAQTVAENKEKTKANFTLKDLTRTGLAHLESTQEFQIDSLSDNGGSVVDKVAPTDSAKSSPALKRSPQESTVGEFDLTAVEFSDSEEFSNNDLDEAIPSHTSKVEHAHTEDFSHDYKKQSFVSEEDSTRVQSTIRQLRQEREEFLSQIKLLKENVRNLEQDNLTLKAAYDESKIEISILRKRHMVELEDMRYRISVNEEKKALAEEKARVAVFQREKLEQRVRIDFNQIKQREKELESKLEMLTIDVDSQVQSRDQKILELRRKIDSLEFNMENVSIKEQKSQDDKRKLEDKLNKIMKTLRHSIKNLEDDIDQATDDSQNDKSATGHKTKT